MLGILAEVRKRSLRIDRCNLDARRISYSDAEGYQLNDSINGVPFTPNHMDDLAYAVNVSTSPVPELASLLLVGTGLSGMAALWCRRKTAI